MVSSNLKKAYIEPLNGKYAGTKYYVLYNPNQYSFEKGNQYQSTAIPGLASPIAQFVSGNADTLTMELFFDTYTDRESEDVRNYTNNIAKLLDMDSNLHAPPIVQFVWGEFVKHLPFIAIIEKLSQKFTMFLDDGTPVRATLNVTFKEYKTVEEQLQEIGRKSTDRTSLRIFKEGDSLWLFASREYGDATLWRQIADKNDIDNPRTIETGRELIIPPLE